MYVKIKHCFLLITEDTSLNSTVMLLNKVILPDITNAQDNKCIRQIQANSLYVVSLYEGTIFNE